MFDASEDTSAPVLPLNRNNITTEGALLGAGFVTILILVLLLCIYRCIIIRRRANRARSKPHRHRTDYNDIEELGSWDPRKDIPVCDNGQCITELMERMRERGEVSTWLPAKQARDAASRKIGAMGAHIVIPRPKEGKRVAFTDVVDVAGDDDDDGPEGEWEEPEGRRAFSGGSSGRRKSSWWVDGNGRVKGRKSVVPGLVGGEFWRKKSEGCSGGDDEDGEGLVGSGDWGDGCEGQWRDEWGSEDGNGDVEGEGEGEGLEQVKRAD